MIPAGNIDQYREKESRSSKAKYMLKYKGFPLDF